MKKYLKIVSVLSVVAMLLLCFTSCDIAFIKNSTDSSIQEFENPGVWADAIYKNDTTVGEGSKTLKVVISAEEKSVTLTIKTDAKTVGEALLSNEIIEGEDSTYGLYIKKVNGIIADYNANKAYWAFYINDEYAVSGVDSTEIDESVTYKLEYTK